MRLSDLKSAYNVEVAAGAVKDLGQIVGSPVTPEEAQTVFGSRVQHLQMFG